MIQLSVDTLEDKIGYRFKNRYLLECALTHTSYAHEQKIQRLHDYERLEFLGDAVLELVSSAFLFEKYPDKHEGEMTKIRSSLVCEPALAYCARDLGLDLYIKLGKGEEMSGGRQKDSIVSDVMEATIGAMYLDSEGIEEPRKYIMKFILSDLEGKLLFYDSKSILQEKAQKDLSDIRYDLIEESGPSHKKVFKVAVMINNVKISEGTGDSKKEAEQRGAYAALKLMKEREEKPEA